MSGNDPGRGRRLLARVTAPLAWRWPGRDAAKLQQFAHAEQGSLVDLMAAANRAPSPARRAMYLRHALDESRHAVTFAKRAAELREARGEPPFPPVRADTEALFERLGEVGFLAFVHLGEQRGRAQFEAYRDWFARRGDERTAAIFEAILRDERQHEAYTRALLVELCGGESQAASALRRARAWGLWRQWRRAGRVLSGATYAALMLVVYVVVVGPMALLGRRRLAATAGYVTDGK